ncbi:MAG: hypothetical protein ACXADU_00160 [Promethearchaeota archaeon]|jgi:hypothetical protein
MFALNVLGWADGLTGSISFIFGCLLGLGIIYQAKKINAKLLSYMGLNIVLAGFFWFGTFLNFLSVLFGGRNLPNPYGWLGILYFSWSPIAFLLSLYIAADLFFPEKKLYVIAPFLILGIIYEFLIFITPSSSFNFIDPPTPGEELIDVIIVTTSPAGLVHYTLIILALIFCAFGYLYKAVRSKDIIRKKFLSLSIGYFMFVGIPIFAAVIGMVEPYTYIARLGMITAFLFFYFGLREAPLEKIKERQRKKDIKVEESLFRLYERPDHITEEEISYYKEKKICLVCKGSLSRLNYICPKCSTLYCNNCSEQLSELENMCWICDEPFDETKPVRPHKKKKPPDGDIPGKT